MHGGRAEPRITPDGSTKRIATMWIGSAATTPITTHIGTGGNTTTIRSVDG